MIEIKRKKNKMKKILILSLFLILAYPNISFAADCSEFQILSHKWNMCKIKGIKKPKFNKSKDEKKKNSIFKRLQSKSLWGIIKGEENKDEEKLTQEEEERLKKEKKQKLLAQKKAEEKIKAEEATNSKNKKSLWGMVKGIIKSNKD